MFLWRIEACCELLFLINKPITFTLPSSSIKRKVPFTARHKEDLQVNLFRFFIFTSSESTTEIHSPHYFHFPQEILKSHLIFFLSKARKKLFQAN